MSITTEINAEVGTDTDTWKGVIGQHGVAGMKNGRYLWQLCCSNGLRIMNTFFPHTEVRKYTCCRRSMDQTFRQICFRMYLTIE